VTERKSRGDLSGACEARSRASASCTQARGARRLLGGALCNKLRCQTPAELLQRTPRVQERQKQDESGETGRRKRREGGRGEGVERKNAHSARPASYGGVRRGMGNELARPGTSARELILDGRMNSLIKAHDCPSGSPIRATCDVRARRTDGCGSCLLSSGAAGSVRAEVETPLPPHAKPHLARLGSRVPCSSEIAIHRSGPHGRQLECLLQPAISMHLIASQR
jgi:hypothetical protein